VAKEAGRVLFTFDESDPRPLYDQLASAVKDQVRSGLLEPGVHLPSVRELADELGVNMHTVRHAYKELEREGVIVVRLGRRARIAPRPEKPAPAREVASSLDPIVRRLVEEAWRLGVGEKEVVERVRKAVGETEGRKR
jgi:GntR family transcriptional regulator